MITRLLHLISMSSTQGLRSNRALVDMQIWRLPLIAVAVTSGSAFMHEVNMISAQGSIDILNEALGAAVPELAAGALVAPSMLASFNQTLCTYNIWPVIPLIAWLVRTLVVHRVHHAPWCLVDMVGQKVVESLWTPNILVCTLLPSVCPITMRVRIHGCF